MTAHQQPFHTRRSTSQQPCTSCSGIQALSQFLRLRRARRVPVGAAGMPPCGPLPLAPLLLLLPSCQAAPAPPLHSPLHASPSPQSPPAWPSWLPPAQSGTLRGASQRQTRRTWRASSPCPWCTAPPGGPAAGSNGSSGRAGWRPAGNGFEAQCGRRGGCVLCRRRRRAAAAGGGGPPTWPQMLHPEGCQLGSRLRRWCSSILPRQGGL